MSGSGTSVVAAIIIDCGRVVLVRRARSEGTLVWTFPSGKLEPGESAAAAAERETCEETGLTVRADTVLGERVHPATGDHLVYVACTPLTGTVHVASPDEVVAVALVEPAELSAYGVRDFHPAVQEHLGLLRRRQQLPRTMPDDPIPTATTQSLPSRWTPVWDLRRPSRPSTARSASSWF